MKFIFCSYLLFLGWTVDIYSIIIPAGNGTEINLNTYRGKNILFVTTASESNHIGQMAALQQLFIQHSDSLVIIALPSNSFGNEPKNDGQIKALLQNTYAVSFPIAAKSNVKGGNLNAISRWLAHKSENNEMNAKARMDFQKFLVNQHGRLVGIFDSSISPLSPMIIDAL